MGLHGCSEYCEKPAVPFQNQNLQYQTTNTYENQGLGDDLSDFQADDEE